MDTVENLLKTLQPNRVLDVATGPGNFIHFLMEHLGSYDEIIGIDTNEKAGTAFTETFKDQPKIHFENRDAASLGYPDATFDLVCISNSLHHMPDLQPVLDEMLRVLKSGGWFLVAEMFRDDQTEAQMTHVLMHHWWGAVDTARGVVHRETYTRQQLLDLLSSLKLQQVALQDVKDLSEDPRDPETMKYLSDATDKYIERLSGLPEEEELRVRGLELRQRLEQVGFHSATSLFFLGKKP